MPRQFSSPAKFSMYLMEVAARMPQIQKEGLEQAAKITEKEAKALIGSYQDAAGPFAKWELLAESTQKERERLGYSPDEPLLRTGKLRDSIGHVVRETEAEIGSNDPRAKWLELGTFQRGQEHIPPRSFLGIAAVHTGAAVARTIGQAVVYGIIGREPPGKLRPLSSDE